MSPSRAPVLSFAHYFQVPATQARLPRTNPAIGWGGTLTRLRMEALKVGD